MPSLSDTPQNMEFINYSKDKLGIKFYYSSGSDEDKAKLKITSGVVEVGKYSGRLFSLSAKNVPSLQQALREVKLLSFDNKNKSNLVLCENAISCYEKEFTPVIKPVIIQVSKSQQLETLLGNMDVENIEETISVLEAASNLGFVNTEQLRIIIEMFLERNK